MVDVHDPAHPECALQPAPEAAEVYAIKRAEYLQGLEYFERREYDLALSLFTALFNELQNTEDQACLNLIMHALTVACHSKLHLGHLTTCTTLCTFLMGKASEVPWQARLLERLQNIRALAEEEQEQRAPAEDVLAVAMQAQPALLALHPHHGPVFPAVDNAPSDNDDSDFVDVQALDPSDVTVSMLL